MDAVDTAPAGSESARVQEALPRTSLPLDPEALAFYLRAARIGRAIEQGDGPQVSFTTGILALLSGSDPLCLWFRNKAQTLGPVETTVRGEKGLAGADLASTGALDKLSDPLLTASSRAVLASADDWAHIVSAQEIGLRHLLAAYLVNPPPNHRVQLRAWKVEEVRWLEAFASEIAERYTSERWRDVLSRPARAAPLREASKVSQQALAWRAEDPAERVLRAATAAYAHAEYQGSLETRTLLFALVELGRSDPAIQDDVQPLLQAIDEEAYLEAKKAERLESWRGDTAKASEKLDLTPQLANLLETARLLAITAARSPAPGVHHLVGALLSTRVEADDDLTRIGLAVPAVRAALLAHVRSRYGGEDDLAWRDLLATETSDFVGRPVQLSSDDPLAAIQLDPAWTSDPLSLRTDVHTFAALLASKSLEPPLSVGLFGAWGSGKTTFMRRLRDAVELYAGKQDPSFVDGIVHVDYNAWHYAESNLVASMVDAVLHAIQAYQGGASDRKLPRWIEADEELKEATSTAEAKRRARDAARETVRRCETELAQRRREARSRRGAIAAARRTAWGEFVASLGQNPAARKSGIIEVVQEIGGSAEALRARLDAARSRPAGSLRSIGWAWFGLFAIAVIVVPLALSWLFRQIGGSDGSALLLTQLGSWLALAAAALRKGAGAAGRLNELIDEVERQFTAKVEESAPVVAAREAASEAVEAAAAAKDELELAEAEVVRAEAALAEALPAAQMARLVEQRISERTYGKLLGTVSDARGDFERLGSYLREVRTAPAGPSGQPKTVERIILYVDDLDRCGPEEVVNVLQLVHMLLAFPLFIVIVAVDARWVRQSLVRRYRWLRAAGRQHGTGDEVSPTDYLEKIFQVAFWLEPMTATQTASYLAALVRRTEKQTRADLEISTQELDFLRMLAAHVGTSPRGVKRLINTYLLIKAGLSDSQLANHLERTAAGGSRSGPYQIALALLVIGNAAPAMLDEIADTPPSETLRDLNERLRAKRGDSWRMAADVIARLRTTQGDDARVADVRGWARRIRRYFVDQASRSDPRSTAQPGPSSGDGVAVPPPRPPPLRPSDGAQASD